MDTTKQNLSNTTAISFLIVVLVWSTTPLAIYWSSLTMHPMLAVSLRMSIALPVGIMLLWLLKIQFSWQRENLKLYCYSGIGLYGGMGFSYLSAVHIPTGLMSLIFGLAPIFSGFFAHKILNEHKFTRIKWLALGVSLIGLSSISNDNLLLSDHAWQGLVYILIAVLFFSISGVYVKKLTVTIHPLATTVGAIGFALPLYIITWLILDGHFEPTQWSQVSILSSLYLAFFGSLISFVCYYSILQKLTVASVSLVTLMTPVIALFLGNYLNNEAITPNMLLGSIAILSGLILYIWGDIWFRAYFEKRL